MEAKVNFKTGSFDFHPIPNFNFQLNRTYAWSNGDLEEIKRVAKKITNAETWVIEMTRIAEKALQEERIEQAIAYFRMAEFFMYDGDPNKIKTYDQAIELFYSYYSELFKSGIVQRDWVPFGSASLPILHAEPENGKTVDTILLHGGYDSYMEEFLQMMLYLRENGFAVYLFEGPGQGGVLRKQGLPFTREWEKPVKAILDFYKLRDITIIGLSLGAILAPRAAAFESRIQRVVAWSLLNNFFEGIMSTRPKGLQRLIKFLMQNKWQAIVNDIMKKQMRKDPLAEWGINHGMHSMGVQTPYEYLAKANQFNYVDVGGKITQDFLLLGADRDHFIPVEPYKSTIDCLQNVKSLTYRLFTEKEQAGNHCNAGNPKLALDTVISWIHLIKNRNSGI
jgi:pimeloyl-ACP methyl ester carboxylesterase